MVVAKQLSVTVPNYPDSIEVFDIGYDTNGNRRYVVHFIELNIELKDYGRIGGLTKYRAKWFGGGYVFQSANLGESLKYYLGLVKEFYNKKEI